MSYPTNPVIEIGSPAVGRKERITSLSASTPLTVPLGARFAMIQALGQNVRWWDDGSVPTASQGQQLTAGATLKYTGGYDGLVALRFIEEAASATLNVTYYT